MKLDIQLFSGGSHNYICCSIENNLVGQMHDMELDDLMKDIVKLTHDLEWADSCDISEEDYSKTVKEFKNKWFKQDRTQRLKKYIDDNLEKTKKELYSLLGGDE